MRETLDMYSLLELGITPQMWHPDYKSLNDKLTLAHRKDLLRIQLWIREAEYNAVEEAKNKAEEKRKQQQK